MSTVTTITETTDELSRSDWRSDAYDYLQHVHELYQDANAKLLEHQGGCSLTYLVTQSHAFTAQDQALRDRNTIIQFRPLRFSLSLDLAEEATRVYGELAPRTAERDLLRVHGSAVMQVVEMSRTSGTRYSELQPRSLVLEESSMLRMRNLIVDVANIFALSWKNSRQSKSPPGRIHTSMRDRLRRLSVELPSCSLAAQAKYILGCVQAGALDDLPVVFTHGDLLPSNIMVSHRTWHLTGLVDWAEAEHLPFGLALYGLDHLLGVMRHDSNNTSPRFQYYAQAEELRSMFWQLLTNKIPSLLGREVKNAVLIARQVGVLLWHGIAWDDGQIDRVVNHVTDGEEVAYLQAFLEVETDGAVRSCL